MVTQSDTSKRWAIASVSTLVLVAMLVRMSAGLIESVSAAQGQTARERAQPASLAQVFSRTVRRAPRRDREEPADIRRTLSSARDARSSTVASSSLPLPRLALLSAWLLSLPPPRAF